MNRDELKKEVGEFIDSQWPDANADIDTDEARDTLSDFVESLGSEEEGDDADDEAEAEEPGE